MAAQQQQQVALDELTVEQLSQIKQQLDEVCRPMFSRREANERAACAGRQSESTTRLTSLAKWTVLVSLQEVQHLTNSFTALKQAQAKFQEAKNSLDDITPERACR